MLTEAVTCSRYITVEPPLVSHLFQLMNIMNTNKSIMTLVFHTQFSTLKKFSNWDVSVFKECIEKKSWIVRDKQGSKLQTLWTLASAKVCVNMCAYACICLSACCPWRYNQPVCERMWRLYLHCASLLFWLSEYLCRLCSIRCSIRCEMTLGERCVFAFLPWWKTYKLLYNYENIWVLKFKICE